MPVRVDPPRLRASHILQDDWEFSENSIFTTFKKGLVPVFPVIDSKYSVLEGLQAIKTRTVRLRIQVINSLPYKNKSNLIKYVE